MSLLDSVTTPGDLRQLTGPELHALAAECRSFLIQSVCRSGGHPGPNLGVVELTIALHRVFDSPRVPIFFDTGRSDAPTAGLDAAGIAAAAAREAAAGWRRTERNVALLAASRTTS